MKPIAVLGASLNHDVGSLISGGIFTITSTPSPKTKESGAGVFSSPLQFTFAGGNASGFVPGSVATVVPQAINSTAQKTKEFGIPVILEGDFVLMACVGTLTAGGASGPVAGNVVIDNAGQEKVVAE